MSCIISYTTVSKAFLDGFEYADTAPERPTQSPYPAGSQLNDSWWRGFEDGWELRQENEAEQAKAEQAMSVPTD